MEKKAYITPAVKIHQLHLADGVMLNTSNSTNADSSVEVETKGANDWDIWDE